MAQSNGILLDEAMLTLERERRYNSNTMFLYLDVEIVLKFNKKNYNIWTGGDIAIKLVIRLCSFTAA